jgi:hypothetical protein
MAYRTFGDLRTQIEQELDLETEDFVQGNEMINYFNSAVRETEAEILKLGLRERYLQDEAFISTVSGQADYTLPSDIIDQQIRKIVYRDGNIIYTLKPLKAEEGFQAEDIYNLYSSSDYYYYSLYKLTEDFVLRLTPKASKTVTNALRVIYHKDLNRYLTGATNCDVPEIAYEFIRASVKYDCVKKEIGRADLADFKNDKEQMRALMTATLQGQIADPDINMVDQDLSAYEDHS